MTVKVITIILLPLLGIRTKECGGNRNVVSCLLKGKLLMVLMCPLMIGLFALNNCRFFLIACHYNHFSLSRNEIGFISCITFVSMSSYSF